MSDAKPKLSKQELRQEIAQAESAAKQLLLVLESWPAFVPTCLAPLRVEKRAAAGLIAVLQCPTRTISTLSMVCHNNGKASSTAERFKPLLPRLVFVSRDELRTRMASWAGADELADELAKSAAAPAAESDELLVVAVEVGEGEATFAHAGWLHGLAGDGAERGPWQYCLNDGRSFSLAPPSYSWSGALRPGRVSAQRKVGAGMRLADWVHQVG
jgi:hypothetical protein